MTDNDPQARRAAILARARSGAVAAQTSEQPKGGAAALPFAAFGIVTVVGVAGVGVASLVFLENVTRGVLLASAILVLTGAFLAGFGVRALQSPTSIQFVAAGGQDAFGVTQYGAARNATAAQGRNVGLICLALGVLLTLVGVAAGGIGRLLPG